MTCRILHLIIILHFRQDREGLPYTGVLSNWKDEFCGCHEYGLCYVLQLDPAAIGAPGRIGMLEDLIDYINGLGDVWWATGWDMYGYYSGCGAGC